MSNNILFKIIDHSGQEYKKAVALREAILRKPFGLKFLPEELEKDRNHIQVVGVSKTVIVATAILAPKGDVLKMQRVAVAIPMQNQGVGSRMILFCEEYALSKSFKAIYCHARDTAVQFYLKCGYMIEGEYFYESGIPHIAMRKIFSR